MFNMNKIPKWFRSAKIASNKSTYKIKIGAVLVKGGSILASGCNEVRYRQIGSNKFSEWKESLHAERCVLSKFNKEDLKGCSLYIWREYEDGSPALSKPCSACNYLITEMNIKKVYYSIPTSPFYEEIKL